MQSNIYDLYTPARRSKSRRGPHIVRASFNDIGCADGAEAFRSGRRLKHPELGQCGDAVIETDLLDNLAVHDLEHRSAREVHLAARRSRKAADQEIAERRAGVGATALPLTDDIVALGDQVRGAPEVEIGERGAEIGHERLDVGAAAPGLMQRIFEQHVGGGDLIDDTEIDGLAPELGEPTTNDGLVII